MNAPKAAGRRDLGSVQLAWLVALREIKTQVRSKSFVISTAIFMLGIVAGIAVPSFLAGRDDGVPDEPTLVAAGPEVDISRLSDPAYFTVTVAESDEAAVAMVNDGTVDAAVVPTPASRGGEGLTVVALKDNPGDVVTALSDTPQVQLLKPGPFGSVPMGYIMSLAFGLLFMMVAMIFGQTIAMNTVIEKQTRVAEILLAAVPDRSLFGGKVVGNAVLALGETVLFVLSALVTLKVTGNGAILDLLTAPLLWYVVFFVVGFILLAALYAGLASLVDRIEDVGNSTMPITLVIMLPYMLPLIFSENAPVMRALSYIPIVSTVTMPIRQIMGEAQWWEALVSLAVLLIFTAGAIVLGAKIYSRSFLQTGKRLKVLQVLRNKA